MDVLHDNSMRTWLQLGDEFENRIPRYVMEYTLPAKEAASEMPDELFADPTRRLFPVDTPAATWLSNVYFSKRSVDGELPYKAPEQEWVQERLAKAAATFGIGEDMSEITQVICEPTVEKVAADQNDNYGWLMKDAATGAVIERRYPMFDQRGVKLASDYFSENRANYPLEVRRTIARNIMRKAAEYGVDTSELAGEVRREAGYGIPRKDMMMNELLERAHLTKDAESAAALANVNELIAAVSGKELAQNLDKIAEVIEEFDRGADLTRYYGTRLLMPADFLYDVDIKEAEAMLEDTVELHRHNFSISKLAELTPDTFNVLGDEFVTAITKTGEEDKPVEIDKTKLADNLYSLPQPDKTALEEHLVNLFQ